MITRSQPIIRWAGSKAKILSALVGEAPATFKRYYEPFVGSGCFYFALKPSRATISDLNPELVSFYQQIRANPEGVFWSSIRFKRTEEQYYHIREQYSKVHDRRKRASMFLYLNRFCFNGIYRTNRDGIYNVPYGSKTGGFPRLNAFTTAARTLKNTKILCEDFEVATKTAEAGDFVYLDPPYAYSEHRDRGEYGPGSFRVNDLSRLESTVLALDRKGANFLLSYIDCPEIYKIGKKFTLKKIPVKRCVASLASRRKVVNEILIKNY